MLALRLLSGGILKSDSQDTLEWFSKCGGIEPLQGGVDDQGEKVKLIFVQAGFVDATVLTFISLKFNFPLLFVASSFNVND